MTPQDPQTAQLTLWLRFQKLLTNEQIEQWVSLLEDACTSAVKHEREQIVSITIGAKGHPKDFIYQHRETPIPPRTYLPE
jgi:hypothetical protein